MKPYWCERDCPIYQISDLAGKRLGALAHSTNLALAEDFPDLELVTFPGHERGLPAMIKALESGDIDALIQDALILLTLEADDPRFRVCVAITYPETLRGGAYYPATESYLRPLNQALKSITD